MKPFKQTTLSSAISTGLKLGLGLSFAFIQSQALAAPGLVDVYQMALQHDAKLAQSQATLQAEKEILTQARSLLMPKINASASLNQNSSNIDGNTGNDQILSLGLDQPLFNKEAFSRYDQAKSKLVMSELKYRLAEQDLIVRVSQAYFDVLLTEQDLRLTKSKEEADKIQWEKAQASSDVGLASRTDVLQARSSYDLSISSRINAENLLDKAYESLSNLTGKHLEQVKQLLLTVVIQQPKLDTTALELRAESNNLKVLSAQQQSEVAMEEVEAVKSGHWFNLNLNAKITDSSYSGYAATAPKKDNQNTSIGVQLTVPIFSGGLTSSQVSEARFKSQSASIAVRDEREQARLDARVQARNLERGHALVEALREAVKSSEAFLEAAEEGYRVGLRNMLDVLTARANLFQAQGNLAEALHNLVLTQLRLQGTLGDLNVDHLRQLDMLLSNPS